MNSKYFTMFIDESGRSSLNHVARFFALSTIIINKNDYEIIEGYLRLLKRNFLKNDTINIHTTDLFERPYMKYRRLVTPNKKKLNKFLTELSQILQVVPYQAGLYWVDKDAMRTTLSYIPVSGKKPKQINLNLPYEVCAHRAISNFTQFLMNERAEGDIVIESRFTQDGDFVKYFDDCRKPKFPGGATNPLAKEVNERINCLTIANKKIVSGGLEIADMAAYSLYRDLTGDPGKTMKVRVDQLIRLHSMIKQHGFVGKDGIEEIKI